MQTHSASSEIELAKCDGSDGQNFVLESNGNLHAATGNKDCLAIYSINGPGVVGPKTHKKGRKKEEEKKKERKKEGERKRKGKKKNRGGMDGRM